MAAGYSVVTLPRLTEIIRELILLIPGLQALYTRDIEPHVNPDHFLYTDKWPRPT